MSLLSIDVGIKNLAMCLIDSRSRQIYQWDVSSVPPQHANGLFCAFKTHLRARPWALDATTVLIEKQLDRNKTMKSIEHFLHAYFLCHDKDVIVYDARHKIPDIAGPGRARYIQRKKASIERCRAFLQATQPVWVPIFDKHKKKDDLADTCMQALSFIERTEEVPVASVNSRPRKPTENQRLTRYSKANLAWLVTQGLHITDKRFEKDLKRYYHSLGELLSEFNLSLT
ncbi:hypothetical protein EBT25_05110 [bacterium]|jgi:hypothetical protein|nr:hypothetical protein [bacterium]